MTDNLFTFVDSVRKIKHLSNEADNELYGIFGRSEGEIKERRINRAKCLMNQANLIMRELYGTDGTPEEGNPSTG